MKISPLALTDTKIPRAILLSSNFPHHSEKDPAFQNKDGDFSFSEAESQFD